MFNSLLKNPDKLSFRGAEGDEESRTSIIFRARFLRLASLGVGMTRLRNVFQQTVKWRNAARFCVSIIRRHQNTRRGFTIVPAIPGYLDL